MATLYIKYALTGGGTDALDGIDGASLYGGDLAWVVESGKHYFYTLENDSGAAESSPQVIKPDANAGDKRWVLQDVYTSGGIVIDQSDLESNGGDIVDTFQTETQPGQGTQVIPVTNSEGYLDQSWIAPAYGIRWDSVNDTYQAGIIQGGSFIATDYTSYPIQERMGRGILANDGQWEKLDPSDSSLFTDGRAATLDGSLGQVMVAIPRFHQLILRDGDYVYFLVSERSFEFKGQKSWIPQGFYKGSDQPVDYRYCGAFEAVAASDSSTALAKSIVKDTSGYSLAEPNPFTNRTRGQFRSQCRDGIFHQFDYGLWEIIAILFVTEYKTWNSQDALPGYTERGSWDYSYTSQAGETVSLGDASGSIYDDGLGLYIANSFRGIENPFGNVWNWLDGINIDNTSGNVHIYTCYDPANFADDTTTNYTDTGHAPGFGDTDGYIKDILGQGQLCPFYPAELGGDSSSYITDYNWNNSGAWRVLRVGGHLSDGAPAGLACLTAHAASSWSYAAIGARVAA